MTNTLVKLPTALISTPNDQDAREKILQSRHGTLAALQKQMRLGLIKTLKTCAKAFGYDIEE